MDASPKQQSGHQVLAQSSLYEASPTPSEEGCGASPVKTRMATRFFSPAAQPPPAAIEAAVATLASTSSINGSSNSMSIPGRSSASMPARCSAPGHLQDSIYGNQLQDSIQQQLGSSSSPAYRLVSAAQSGKHKLQHSQDAAGSHTSLLLVEYLEGTQVGVEHFVPRNGEAAKDTMWPCTFNLSKVILGAGMMAIPKAFMLLGLIPGSILMLAIACLTYFTLAGLISASAATGAGSSYGALVRHTIGSKAEHILQYAVLANCYIMEVVFVVVLGDILVGTAPDYGGVLPEWTGLDPASCFWLRRDVVLAALSLLVLLPLAAMRSMAKLAIVNILGVASNGAFAGVCLFLAAAAASNGVLQPPPLFPDWSQLGSTPLTAAVAIAVVVPVLLNCDVCHQSLHPLMPLLQPYSVARMQRLVAIALATCNAVYITVIICSGLVFGDALEADVLANINSAAMAPLIGPTAAVVTSSFVRVGYLLSLIGSYVLLCYPLRQCLGDQFLPGGQAAVQKHWLLITTLIVVSASAIGCYLPSIWGALALVGATTSTVQAFIIPGLVILSVERAAAKAGAAQAASSIEGLAAPLLAPFGDAEAAVADSSRGRSRHTSAPAFKVDREPQAPWLCVVRQLLAAFAVVVGVALFANSVVEAVWRYAHPRAEGMAVGSLYRLLVGQ